MIHKDAVWLVTGCSKGLGRALAEQVLAAGYRAVVTARRRADVDDLAAARDQLVNEGARVLGDGLAKLGAHGLPVLFLHPKDTFGTLIELEQRNGDAAP